MDTPEHADWQVTHACQLRCSHCYTESGRRPIRQLSARDRLLVADKLIALGIKRVLMCGGEPLLITDLIDVITRLVAGGIAVTVYTNGIALQTESARRLAELECQVHVSVDGACATTNDHIRGAGSFAAATRALGILENVARERKCARNSKFRFGLDVTLVRSNFQDIEAVCSLLAPRYEHLSFLQFSAVIPSGLAARERFAAAELLTMEQLLQIERPDYQHWLRSIAPSSLEYISIQNNLSQQLYSSHVEPGPTVYSNVLEIEPDGSIRALVTYEGVVGNILTDDPHELWRRCRERARHPAVIEALTPVKTPEDWAAAVRHLDRFFATPSDLLRYTRRSEFDPLEWPRPLRSKRVVHS